MTPLQQAVAANNASAFARMEDCILPEVWELNRWLLASLLALNTAAGAAIYASDKVPNNVKTAACWWFIYGSLAALASGFLLTFVLRALQVPTGEGQHYWSAVGGGASRDPETEKSLALKAARAARWSFIPQIALYVSVACFIVGIIKLPA